MSIMRSLQKNHGADQKKKKIIICFADFYQIFTTYDFKSLSIKYKLNLQDFRLSPFTSFLQKAIIAAFHLWSSSNVFPCPLFSRPRNQRITGLSVILSIHLPLDRFNVSAILTNVFAVQFLRFSRDGDFTSFPSNLLSIWLPLWSRRCVFYLLF